jgi:phage shock protein E
MPRSPSRRTRTRVAAVLAAVAVTLTLAACAEDSADATPPAAVAGTSEGVRQVPAVEAVDAATEDGVVVLDVRTPAEFDAGHLAGARNLPLSPTFESEVSALPRDGRYLLYCKSGNRSGQAAQVMSQLGFTDVRDGGGIPDLEAAGATVVTG